MTIEFEISGIQYKASKIDGMTQVFIAKRMAPFSMLAGPLFGKKELDLAEIPILAQALAAMPDEDLDFICHNCLSLCERQNSVGGWARIWNREIHKPMFDDIGMIEIAKIVGELVKGSFGNFSQGRP